MNCPKCHKELPVGANICPSCGMNFTQMRVNAPGPAQGTRGNGQRSTPAPRRGAPQTNPQALMVAAGLVIVFLVLLVLLFRFIFGGGNDDQNIGSPIDQQQNVTQPTPSPTFKIFGVDVSTPEPVVTVDPLANLMIEAPTPTPAPTIEPQYETLRKGSKGDEVKRLQEALIALGYLDDGGADGDYGNGTVAAVKEFQKDNGLTADGHAGQQTLSTLYRKYGGDINKTTTTQTTTTTTTDASTLILDQPG